MTVVTKTIGTATHAAQSGTMDSASIGATALTGTSTDFAVEFDDGDRLIIDHAVAGLHSYNVNGEPASSTSITISGGLVEALSGGETPYKQGSVRDYSTITLWEAALTADDPTGAYDAVGECYDDSAFDETFSIIDAAPDSITLSVASGERHDGTAGSGARIVRTGDDGPVLGRQDNTTMTVEWLEVDLNGNAGNHVHVLASVSATNTVANCIVHGGDTGVVDGILTGAFSNTTNNILNCIVYNVIRTVAGGTAVSGIANNSSTSRPFNCMGNTVHGVLRNSAADDAFGISISSDLADKVVKNNIIVATGGSSSGTHSDINTSAPANAIITYNMDEDGTLENEGTNVRSVTVANQFESTTGGSEDFHLKTGADAINVGDELGTTPTGVNIDIDGVDRTVINNWDMGAADFVSSGIIIEASLGTLTITGLQASIDASTVIDASLGTLVITGLQASIDASTEIDASLGTLTITGLQASIDSSTEIDASLGTLQITGLQASIDASKEIDATLGTLEITGLQGTVETGTVITASLGTLIITGLQASIDASTEIDASLGTLTITGLQASIDASNEIDASLGTLQITGLQASIDASTEIDATLGTLEITGLQATVDTGTVIDASLGTLTITGLQASIDSETNIDATLGTLTITGLQASVVTGVTIDASLGTLTITGLQASIDSETNIDASLGTLTITGLQASVEEGTEIDATLGTLTITGLQASIDASREIDASLGTLTITGLKASVVSVGTHYTVSVGHSLIISRAEVQLKPELSQTLAIANVAVGIKPNIDHSLVIDSSIDSPRVVNVGHKLYITQIQTPGVFVTSIDHYLSIVSTIDTVSSVIEGTTVKNDLTIAQAITVNRDIHKSVAHSLTIGSNVVGY